MQKLKYILSKFVYFIFAAYMYTMIIAVPWFNWQYAKDNGFMKWLLLGEFVSTGKALIWPYYVFLDSPKWEKDWEQNTEMLAYTITGSWTAINDSEAASQIPAMITFQKKWVSGLPKDVKTDLNFAANEFKNAWLEIGQIIAKTPESLFDISIYEYPSVKSHVDNFSHVYGLRNSWDRIIQYQVIEVTKFKEKYYSTSEGTEEKEKALLMLSSVFHILYEQGNSRMSETISIIFSEN